MQTLKQRKETFHSPADVDGAPLSYSPTTTSSTVDSPMMTERRPVAKSTETFSDSISALPARTVYDPEYIERRRRIHNLVLDRCPPPFSWLLRFLSWVFLLDTTLSKGVPILRGKIHLLLVYISPLWIVSLLNCCNTTRAILTVILLSISSLFNFSMSALLHNHNWSESMFVVVTNLDYAGIYLMICGSCSSIPLILLKSTTGLVILAAQFIASIVGMVICLSGSFSGEDIKKFRAQTYVFVGVSNGLFCLRFVQLLTGFELSCLVVMGVLYIIGAVFYVKKTPNLWPGVFGYHELFHFCCLCAGIFALQLNRSILRRSV